MAGTRWQRTSCSAGPLWPSATRSAGPTRAHPHAPPGASGTRARGSPGAPALARLDLVTTSADEALAFADVVVLSVPAFVVPAAGRALGPFLRERHTVVVLGCTSLGSLRFRVAVGGGAAAQKFRVAEASSLPYAARLVGPGRVAVYGRSVGLHYAALPASDTAAVAPAVAAVAPGAEPAESPLHLQFFTENPILHPAAMLMNAGRIEDAAGTSTFSFYRQGVTPSVGRVISAIDAERMSVAGALGFAGCPSAGQLLHEHGYGAPAESGADRDDVVASCRLSPVLAGINAPPEVATHRYLVEDALFGLDLLRVTARTVGVATPTIDAIVHLARVVRGAPTGPIASLPSVVIDESVLREYGLVVSPKVH
eukprot:m51a1_g3989 hypothetical protein (368) ;mRNA; f:489867-490970